jgi:Fe(3+) dicitrate transport protein
MASVGLSYMSGVFSDAANTQVDPSGQFGWVDASALLDASLEVHLGGGMRVSASIMNAADVRYHTLRATVYPGPGILPGDGRTAMLTLRQDW